METKTLKDYKVFMQRDCFKKVTFGKFFSDEQAIEFASVYARAGGACYIVVKRGEETLYNGWMY